jgi:mono/diheme cytochrome c family protein
MNWKIALFAMTILSLPAPTLAEAPLERGTYLMQSIVACGNCHTIQTPEGPMPGMELAGGMVIEDPAFKANVPNITPDPETGIGRWTDEQIILAIREGRRPDGTIIGPPMPIGHYRGISDEDAKAIVAYLRAVKPVKNAVARSAYPFPLPPNYGPPVGKVEAPPRGDRIAYGAYLAMALGHCTECHSTPNAQGVPDVENALGAGGMSIHGPWGISVAPNITPTGLGSWTDDQIRTAITKGLRPDGARLKPPMAFGYYANIAADDLDAIVAYLRSLPPK